MGSGQWDRPKAKEWQAMDSGRDEGDGGDKSRLWAIGSGQWDSSKAKEWQAMDSGRDEGDGRDGVNTGPAYPLSPVSHLSLLKHFFSFV